MFIRNICTATSYAFFSLKNFNENDTFVDNTFYCSDHVVKLDFLLIESNVNKEEVSQKQQNTI
jgi:hypothetical protein